MSSRDLYILIALLSTACYLAFFLYYLLGWWTLHAFRPPASFVPNTRISVVISARNEERYIPQMLQDLHGQDYPAGLWEVWIVDDHSEDRTAALLEAGRASGTLPLHLISLAGELEPEEVVVAYKKKALETAINLAGGTLLVTTDADCRLQPHWLSRIAALFEQENCNMVAGPVLYEPSGSFFMKMQALDFAGFQGITAACLRFHFANMCNGANLAFRKSAYEAVGGYKGTEQTASGDDMLLMHKIARRYPGTVRFLKNREAAVYTHAEPTWRGFWQQRLRWTSKSRHYTQPLIPGMLGAVFVFYGLLLLTALLGLRHPPFLMLAAIMAAVKLLIDFIFLWSVTRWFRQLRLMFLFLPAWLFHLLYVTALGTLAAFIKPTWKGRKTR